MIRNFASCHVHPQSLDSASTPKAFAEREVELGTGVLTATDHGSLAACRKVYDLAKEHKLIPVLGLEAYFRDDNCPIFAAAGIPKNADGKYVDYLKYAHITMHALDQPAYEGMVRLLSAADARAERHGSERKPLFDWATLEELGGMNITMTTGCMIGIVQRHLLDNNDLGMAKKYLDKLKSIVRPGNLYVEVFPHDTSKNWVEGVFITLGDGSVTKVYDKKKLMTNVGEIQAGNLARVFSNADNKHAILKSIKDYSVWREMPEQEIVKIEKIEDFQPNECRPWAPDGDLQAGLNRAMRVLAKQYDLKVLIGDDSHFAQPDEKVVQDVRLAQSGSWRFYGSYHRQSSEEAYAHFKKTIGTQEKEFEGWVENSHEWAERFKNFVFDSQPSLPTKFYEPLYEMRPWFKAGNADNSLRYTMDLIKKHGRMDWSNPVYVARLKQEIQLLHHNGTIDLLPYFFIDEEVCSLYEAHAQLTGSGRGSAAGILLTYLLGITHVDPLKYDLSVDRFLTLDRVRSGKLPDIDQDLPHRDLLIDPADPTKGWLRERFGDHVSQISVDSTLKLKMAVKDVSRSQRGFVPPELEVWTKKFAMPPQGVDDYDFVMGYDTDDGNYITGSVETDPALREYVKRYPKDWEIVQKCLGLARQKGRHACAFVIANRPIHEFIPLTSVGDVSVTAYTAPSVEAVGGLKMDFLVVNSLNDIGDAIKLIQKRTGKQFVETKLAGRRVPWFRLVPHKIDTPVPFDPEAVDAYKVFDIWDLPADQAVFADVACGRTETVFQYNTPGAVQWLEHFGYQKPNGNYAIDSVDGMAAFTALDRPGPLDMNVPNPDDGGEHNLLVEYARRARGATPSPGVLKVFDELIPETYGVMVYQEQLQRVYQQLTGCSGPEAEEFRTLAAKKKLQKLQKLYTPFIERASAKIGEESAKAAWEFFITWAKYGFNKSHAVCYAVTGYACAYLKHHYPLEWWTSVLKNASKNEVNEKFWRHCGHLIDLPDVKLSGPTFEIQNERIRAPLNLLMGVGETAHAQISKYAPYTDIVDFCQKIEQHREETGAILEKEERYKDTKNKFRNEEGKLVSPEVVGSVKVLKKGYSALNRGVVHTLILSGAMDSLFPSEMHVGEQLMAYERAMADAVNATAAKIHAQSGSVKKYKVIKPEEVDPAVWDIGPVRRYQTRKGILPAYGADLIPFLRSRTDLPIDFTEGATPVVYYEPPRAPGRVVTLGVAQAADISKLERTPIEEGTNLEIAVVAYVESTRPWSFEKDGNRQEACELQLDVEGERFKFVKWGRKKEAGLPDIFKTPLKGAVVLAVLNRFRSDKPFSLEDLLMVQAPLEDKKTTEPKEHDAND